MEEKRNNEIWKLFQELWELPEEPKKALFDTLCNFPFVLEFCENSNISEEEIEQYLKDAAARKDYRLLALFCILQAYQHESKLGNLGNTKNRNGIE